MNHSTSFYLKYISGPSTSSAAPLYLGFVHQWAALFQADLIQDAVGLQRGRDVSEVKNHLPVCYRSM